MLNTSSRNLVLDLCSRRVVGWSLAEQMTETLVLDALVHAIRDRQPAPALVHHSDRGGQYAGQAYRAVLRRAQFRQSMSRAANYVMSATHTRLSWAGGGDLCSRLGL